MTTLILTYLLNLFDLAMTTYWVRLYGLSIEANPIGRWLYENNLAGAFKILVVGALFALLGYLLKLKPKCAWVAYIPLVVYGFVVMYHIYLFLIPIL